MNVTGLVRKPSLSESGASISIGGDVCYGGSPVLASKVIPADAGELTWLWLVDGEPQIYYETVGELAIPRDWTGEEPYWIRLSGAGWVGKDVVLRVKAANYGGVLESSPVRIGGIEKRHSGLSVAHDAEGRRGRRLLRLVKR